MRAVVKSFCPIKDQICSVAGARQTSKIFVVHMWKNFFDLNFVAVCFEDAKYLFLASCGSGSKF
jgi:hypothetical protein